jgi:hypothetical protein
LCSEQAQVLHRLAHWSAVMAEEITADNINEYLTNRDDFADARR